MFDQLIASIPQTVRRKAEKCTVRECDETEPGVFIAYVDAGDETFDVSVSLKKESLVASSCDCKKASVCEHKAALLLFLSNPPAKKATVVKAKKQDPLLTLLSDTDPELLKKWLSELIQNNKDIRLAFELQFAQSAALSIEEIANHTKNALKTVVKNKKNVDVNQLKKIVDLWTKIHDPVVEEYYNAVFSRDAFDRFHSAMKTCALEQERISTLSNKIPMYISERIMKALENIHLLHDEVQWQSAIDLLFSALKDSTHLLKLTYLELLKNLYLVSSSDRKESLMRQLMGRYNEILSIHPYYKKEVAEFFLRMVIENKLFDRYAESFQAIDYAYNFNMLLVDSLVEISQFTRAEKICQNEIKFHTKNNERPGYYRALLDIYRAQENEQKILETVQRLFPYTFDFADYKFAADRMSKGHQRTTWRTMALKMVQAASKHMHNQAIEFQLLLALDENDMNRALHLVENGCPYLVILAHVDQLIEKFQDTFLFALINRYDDHYYISNQKQMEAEMNAVASLITIILETYGVEKPQAILQKIKSKRKIIHAELPMMLASVLS